MSEKLPISFFPIFSILCSGQILIKQKQGFCSSGNAIAVTLSQCDQNLQQPNTFGVFWANLKEKLLCENCFGYFLGYFMKISAPFYFSIWSYCFELLFDREWLCRCSCMDQCDQIWRNCISLWQFFEGFLVFGKIVHPLWQILCNWAAVKGQILKE